MTFSFTFDAPTRMINANHRRHRMATAALTAAWRVAAKEAANRCRIPTMVAFPVRVIIYVHAPTRRKYDAGNLYPTAKAIIDGLTDYGLWPDDDNDRVIGPDMRRGDHRKNQPGVTVTLHQGWTEQ